MILKGKKSTVIIKTSEGFFRVFVKGAVDGMIDSFKLSVEEKESIMMENDAIASKTISFLLSSNSGGGYSYFNSYNLRLEPSFIGAYFMDKFSYRYFSSFGFRS